MANRNFGAGIDRLNSLLTPDLCTKVDGTNLAAVHGWGTLFTVVNLVKGIRALRAAGCYGATPALYRPLIEYTLGAVWLADDPDGAVDVLVRKFLFTRKILDKSLTGQDRARFPSEAVANFDAMIAMDLPSHPDQYLAAIKPLLKEYGLDYVIPVYNVVTGYAHLSYEGTQLYIADQGEAIGLSQDPLHDEVMPGDEICLSMQFETMRAYNELLIGKPWTNEVAAIAADFEMTFERPTRKTRRGNTASGSP